MENALEGRATDVEVSGAATATRSPEDTGPRDRVIFSLVPEVRAATLIEGVGLLPR